MEIEIGRLIFTVVYYVIWLMCLSKLGNLFFPKGSNRTIKYFIFLCVLVIAEIYTIDNYLAYSLIQQTLLICFCSVMLCGNTWEKVGLSCVFVALWEFVWNGIDSLLSIFDIALSNNMLMSYKRIDINIITLFAFLLTGLFMYIIFRRTALAYGIFLFGSGRLLFSVMAPLLILIDVCNFGITHGVVMAYNGAENWNTAHNEMFTHIGVFIISMLCMAICFLLLFGMNRLIEYITLDTTNKMEINRYKTMLWQYRNQVSVRHDMKNHLISMSALAENGQWDKLKEYMSKIYGTAIVDNMDIETGNSVVNAIVNIKAQEARRQNIKFECDVNMSRHLNIDEYDLCVIWGNILDNAINAAGTIDGEKYVYVQGEIVKRNLIINVKNSIKQNMSIEKFGKQNWGTGITNVNKIVQRLKGIMNIEIKDDAFEISIMLPVAEHTVYDIK